MTDIKRKLLLELSNVLRTNMRDYSIYDDVVADCFKYRTDQWLQNAIKDCLRDRKLLELIYDEAKRYSNNYSSSYIKCSCGANHTDNPRYHYKYCDRYKEDK